MFCVKKLFSNQRSSDFVPPYLPPYTKWFHSPEDLDAKYAASQDKAEKLAQHVCPTGVPSNKVREQRSPVVSHRAPGRIESLFRAFNLVEAPDNEVTRNITPLSPKKSSHEAERLIWQPTSGEAFEIEAKERHRRPLHPETSGTDTRELILPCLRPGNPQNEAGIVNTEVREPIPPCFRREIPQNEARRVENEGEVAEQIPPPLPPRRFLMLPPEVLRILRSQYRFPETPRTELTWEYCMIRAAENPCEIPVPTGEKVTAEFVLLLMLV